MTYERKNIQLMEGYVPGEQPEKADIIKLNTNENPFPPGPLVKQALAGINTDSLRRYPPPTALELRQSIAKLHKLNDENIVVTNGGDELLRLVISTFVDDNEAIAVAEPTYTLYEVLAQAHGCELIRFKLNKDYSLPDNFCERLNQTNAKVCILPNPNAPSGTLTSEKTLSDLAAGFKGILLIDEAYVDFVDPELAHDCLSLINQLNNVLILRTFSKGYSLAGLRMAYGIGPEALIKPMQSKTKDSYNTDFIAQRLAQAAIEDQAYAQASWNFVRRQRDVLKAALDELGFSSLPSQSNFLLTTVPSNKSAEALYLALKEQGVLVRYFNQSELQNCLRISVGTETENQRLLNTLTQLIS